MKNVLYFLLTIIVLSALSCKKTKQPIKEEPIKRDVYISGYEYLQTSFNTAIHRAVYYKNGEKKYLGGENEYTEAAGITVNANDVYIAGLIMDGGKKSIVYWKNGIKNIVIEEQVAFVKVHDLKVVGNDMYILGKRNLTPCYWKNGKMIEFANGNLTAVGTRIFVENNNVYVMGHCRIGGKEQASYWKNGVLTTLSDGTSIGQVTSLKIIGNDTYITMVDGENAYYIKNDKKNHLGKGIANDINVSDNDIFISGSVLLPNGGSVAAYWKNGNQIILDGKLAAITKSIVIDGNIFSIGYENHPDYYNGNNSTIDFNYWYNEKSTLLRNGIFQEELNDIFVK